MNLVLAYSIKTSISHITLICKNVLTETGTLAEHNEATFKMVKHDKTKEAGRVSFIIRPFSGTGFF